MVSEPPEGFEQLDDPVTLSVADYIPRIAATIYPDRPLHGAAGSIKLVRQRIDYAQKAKKNRLSLFAAPPPFPAGHVFAEEFFRWAKTTWGERIPWIHPHYGRTPVTTGCATSWKNTKHPDPPPTYEELQREVQRLQEENKKLVTQLRQAEERANRAERKLKAISDRAKASYQKRKAADAMGGRPKST